MNTKHRTIQTNGIEMHIAEQGQGPVMVLCHGFPESWYSWRHQLPALAAAGFHAVAPDQRGYGDTSRPEAIDAYNIFDLTADIVGLVHALGESQAIIVGHDWGSPVAWHCALLRPDIFRAVVLLSVPYLQRPWNGSPPTALMARAAGERQFYQLYFQEPGKAEAEMEADVRGALSGMLYAASGDCPVDERWRLTFDKGKRFVDTLSVPDRLPPWLTENDLDVYESAFRKTGFRGGLNWYRNIDRNWERSAFLGGAPLRQPTLFIGGEHDPVIAARRSAYDALEQTAPNLWRKVLLPGAGHWIQQERPSRVNELLIEFIGSV